MDHSHHHHESMNAMDERCWMSMLWNTNVINTCIVFRQWHIRSHFQFILSFLAIMALGCAYEYLRDLQRRVDQKVAIQLVQSGKGKNVVSRRPQNGGRIALEEEEQDELMLSSLKADRGVDVPFGSRVLRASLYGASVFLSFFLMLVFMTYNGYLILATVLGAALGHYIYGGRMDPDAVLGGGLETKGMSCH